MGGAQSAGITALMGPFFRSVCKPHSPMNRSIHRYQSDNRVMYRSIVNLRRKICRYDCPKCLPRNACQWDNYPGCLRLWLCLRRSHGKSDFPNCPSMEMNRLDIALEQCLTKYKMERRAISMIS
jgi:hypothetical protein